MEIKVKIKNLEGLHARPAGVFAKKVAEFKSSVNVVFNGQTKNAKSVMALMGLGIKVGEEITLMIEGPDAELASVALVALIDGEFKL